VKVGSVDPEIVLLKGLFKMKLTEAKHIARGACMPRGLDNTIK